MCDLFILRWDSSVQNARWPQQHIKPYFLHAPRLLTIIAANDEKIKWSPLRGKRTKTKNPIIVNFRFWRLLFWPSFWSSVWSSCIACKRSLVVLQTLIMLIICMFNGIPMWSSSVPFLPDRITGTTHNSHLRQCRLYTTHKTLDLCRNDLC